MAGYAMNKASFSAALSLILLLCACGSGGGQGETPGQSSEPPLNGAAIGGPFTLVDQDGNKASWSDFAGKYRMLYFGYTFCPDVCPMDLQKLMQGYRLFEKQDPVRAARVQPIFITIDPQRDTQAVMKDYVAAFHPRLIGLTGSPEEIGVVAKNFAVYYAKAGDSPRDYLMDHSRSPYLMDMEGKPLAILPTDQPGTPEDEGAPEKVAAELDRWVK